MFKKITFIAFVLFFSNTIKAQKLTQFSSDSVKFIKELNEYFIEFSANKEIAHDYMSAFSKEWKSPNFASNYRQAVYKTSNAMLQRKLKPYPFFMNYLNTVVNCIKSGQESQVFENWQKCIEKIFASKNLKSFTNYLEMSETIFLNNAFYNSPTYAYKSQTANFKFEFDSIPKVIFSEFNLVGLSPRGDSIMIEKTSGTYYPTWGKFIGKGGKLNWSKTDINKDVYADLKNIVIDCKTGGYSTDSAIFYGKQYFEKPQIGRVTDKIITENGESTYPRFDSYSKRLLVKNIYPDVDYDGGFGMRGNKFVGTGNSSNPAKIVFNRNNKKFLEISARSFSMTKEKTGIF